MVVCANLLGAQRTALAMGSVPMGLVIVLRDFLVMTVLNVTVPTSVQAMASALMVGVSVCQATSLQTVLC